MTHGAWSRDLASSPVLRPPTGAAGARGFGSTTRIVVLLLTACGAANAAGAGRERLLMDFNWRFHLGNAADPARDFDFDTHKSHNWWDKQGTTYNTGALKDNFDDSTWKTINLPHDWGIDLPFDPGASPTLGFRPLGREYPGTSIGWYRKAFDIPESDRGRRLSLEFDGVFRDSQVFVNGIGLGVNASGYAPFRYDITDFVNYGGRNFVVVRVNATMHEGWWYEGAGIYRHVWLVKTAPVYVPQWGTFVTSEIRAGGAVVTARTEVADDSGTAANVIVASSVVDASGAVVAQTSSAALHVPSWGRAAAKATLRLQSAQLWSLESPYLYRLITLIRSGVQVVDRYETTFGIRTIRFDPQAGFLLNGKPVKIQGLANHETHAGVGAAMPDRLQAWRIETLKAMGANAYRTAHNPPAPALLDACDRLGMLVLDETRMFGSTREALSQLDRLVRRDRNHPSVILWSIGNEEPLQSSDTGRRMAEVMIRLAHRLDPTRLTTFASNNGGTLAGVNKVVDVRGVNYLRLPSKDGNIDDYHRARPRQPLIGTEETSNSATRGEYASDPARGVMSNIRFLGARPIDIVNYWPHVIQRPWYSGLFIWTGFDYYGESNPLRFPNVVSQFGVMDLCGFPKDIYYYLKSWWQPKPVLHLLPDWNQPGMDGKPVDVYAFTNCSEVELSVNGQSAGRKAVPPYSYAHWNVTYAPGTLRARCFQNGTPTIETTVETTRPASAIRLTPDRTAIHADGEDAAIVNVELVDAAGRVVLHANSEITFHLESAGRILGVGNGNPTSTEPDHASKRRAFHGLAQVIVQAPRTPGEIVLRARAEGLRPAVLHVRAEASPLRPLVPEVYVEYLYPS
jgi:beta-galactosidase